jgi:hypothetical protein
MCYMRCVLGLTHRNSGTYRLVIEVHKITSSTLDPPKCVKSFPKLAFVDSSLLCDIYGWAQMLGEHQQPVGITSLRLVELQDV